MDKSVEKTHISALPARSVKTLCLCVALSLSALAGAAFLFFESGFMFGYDIFLTVIAVSLAACAWGVYAKGAVGCVSAIRVFVGVRQILSAVYAFLLTLAAVLTAVLLIKADADAVLSVPIALVLLILLAYRALLFFYYRGIRASLSNNETDSHKTLKGLSLAACIASALGAIAFVAAYLMLFASLKTALVDFDVTEKFLEVFPSGLLSDADKIDLRMSALEMLFPHFALAAAAKLVRTALFGSVFALSLDTKD